MIRRLLCWMGITSTCPHDLDEEYLQAVREQQRIERELRLRWIRYQADQLQRMKREHKDITDELWG